MMNHGSNPLISTTAAPGKKRSIKCSTTSGSSSYPVPSVVAVASQTQAVSPTSNSATSASIRQRNSTLTTTTTGGTYSHHHDGPPPGPPSTIPPQVHASPSQHVSPRSSPPSSHLLSFANPHAGRRPTATQASLVLPRRLYYHSSSSHNNNNARGNKNNHIFSWWISHRWSWLRSLLVAAMVCLVCGTMGVWKLHENRREDGGRGRPSSSGIPQLRNNVENRLRNWHNYDSQSLASLAPAMPRIIQFHEDGTVSAVAVLPVIASAPNNSDMEDQNDHSEIEIELASSAVECVPMAKWQTRSFPNCNIHHEIDLPAATYDDSSHSKHDRVEDRLSDGPDLTSSTSSLWRRHPRHHQLPRRHSSTSSQYTLHLLGEGWFRTTWAFDHFSPSTSTHDHHDGAMIVDAMVLKMLRIERDFTDEFFELHRRDAIALERLTPSRFVVNVYGYCGQSTINERANFEIDGVNSLEQFDRRLRGQHSHHATILKLRVGASVAAGLADVHSIALEDDEIHRSPKEKRSNTTASTLSRVSMVHYDLNPRNVALFKGGRPKLNDFNIAEFLRVDPVTNQTCGFRSRMHEPWWRAPEEMDLHSSLNHTLDEKVDVYALGNVLFHILTSHSPRGKMVQKRMEMVRKEVAQGTQPVLPEPYASDPNPVYEVFRQALALCHVADPRKRGSAAQVSALLMDALVNLQPAD